MSGVLDYAPALATNLNVDDTGNTFAGVLNGKFKVYVDPYAANILLVNTTCKFTKGTSPTILVCSIAHMFHYKW